MARLAAMAASSHNSACSRHPLHSLSTVVSIAATWCLSSAAATWEPSAVGGVWRRSNSVAAACSYFGEESGAQPSPHFRRLLACQILWGPEVTWWRATASSLCCEGTGGGAQVEVEQEEDPRLLALEAELYDFMLKSSKPNHFPTKEELITAGRMDLVEAIADDGGWLAYGCDFGDDDEAASSDYGYGDDDGEDGDNMDKGGQLQGGESRDDANNSLPESAAMAMEHNETAVCWEDKEVLQQQREVDAGEESGIEGILNRLEKERSFYLEADNRISSKNKGYDPEAAASEVFSYGNISGVDNLLSNVPESSAGHDWKYIHSRLQFLKSELDSVLSSLRSRTDVVVSYKGQEGSLEDSHKFSDALEFQETEIMNVQDKLRAIQAKLAAFEGKMALDIAEAHKIAEEKQKRIAAAQKALCHLRTAYVVWPYLASEVFLVGSFDGWTSQIRMEKSSTGIFSLNLKLYPGQYEIKFIVDGVWKIDPLRPLVYNDGYDNNVLIVQ